MHPAIQYEFAKMRADEFRREADRERLARSLDPHPAIEWTGVLARLHARLFGSRQVTEPRPADAGA